MRNKYSIAICLAAALLFVIILLMQPNRNVHAQPTSSQAYKRGVSELADTVLDHIAHTNQEQKSTESSSSLIQSQPFQARKPHSKYRLQWLLGVAAAVLCVAIVGGVWNTIMLKSSATNNAKPSTQPFVGQWDSPADIPAVQHGQDVFALKYISYVNDQEFSLIYAFHSSQYNKVPQIHVVSVLPSHTGSTITIGSSIQPLGTLGEFEIGAIHMRVSNRVGQSILLQGLFSDQKSSWTVSVINQVHPLRLGGPNIGYGEGGGY